MGPTADCTPPVKSTARGGGGNAPADLRAALDRLRAAHVEAVAALEGAGLARDGARAVVERLVAVG